MAKHLMIQPNSSQDLTQNVPEHGPRITSPAAFDAMIYSKADQRGPSKGSSLCWSPGFAERPGQVDSKLRGALASHSQTSWHLSSQSASQRFLDRPLR